MLSERFIFEIRNNQRFERELLICRGGGVDATGVAAWQQ
jgi:hypothetical protein